MHLRQLLPLLALLLPACGGPGSGKEPGPGAAALKGYRPAVAHAAVVPDVDVEHYALDLRLEPAGRRLEGTARVRLYARATELRVVTLDLVGLEVASVSDGRGRALEFEHASGKLAIELAEPLAARRPLELVVRYGGSPTRGLYFVGAPANQVFTQGQCADARYWFPCVDVPTDRATSEITVRLPAGWSAVAAGERVTRRDVPGGVLEHWRMHAPHPTYLTTLVAGELASLDGTWDGLPLSFHAPAPWAAYLEPCLVQPTRDALAFLSEFTGRRFPYAKYSTACVDHFPSGGMENVSATTLTLRALRDADGLADDDGSALIVHEAAHQWFGDLVTCADWSHVWLNEGFATYAELLYIEAREGPDAFRAALRPMRARALANESRPLVHDVYKDPADLLDGQAYHGGAARLHLLRFVLGDAAFRRGVQLYVGRNAGRAVVTADLQRAFEEASGEDLGPFFAQWVYGRGHPALEVRWRYDAERERVLLTVNQTHAADGDVPEMFSMPVDVEVRDADGPRMVRITVAKRREMFELPAPKEPEWVRFDKYGWLPARIVSQKGTGEWLRIAAQDDDVNGRRDALAELAARFAALEEEGARATILESLVERLEHDDSIAVRVAAARALGELGVDGARAALERRLEEADEPAVHVAALDALRAYCPDAALAQRGAFLFGSGSTWAVRGAGLVLAAHAEPVAAATLLGLAVDENDSAQGDLARHRARAYGVLGDVKALVALLGDTAAPPAPRAEAARQLGRVGARDAAAKAALGSTLKDADPHVRRAALAALAAHGDAPALVLLRAYYAQSQSSRERRKIEAAFGLE